jgi:hypothetical protein
MFGAPDIPELPTGFKTANSLPRELIEAPQWVNWTPTPNDDGTLSKKPSDTWKVKQFTYETANSTSKDIGFVILDPDEEKRIVCIDIDHVEDADLANRMIQ